MSVQGEGDPEEPRGVPALGLMARLDDLSRVELERLCAGRAPAARRALVGAFAEDLREALAAAEERLAALRAALDEPSPAPRARTARELAELAAACAVAARRLGELPR